MKTKEIVSMLSLCVMITLIGSSSVSANTTIKDDFNTAYGTTGTRLDDCATCHTTAPELNPYGVALNDSGLDFAAIEPDDSDGDGFSNIDEIDNLTFPGDPNDFPQEAPVEEGQTYNITGYKINGSDGTVIPNWNISLTNDTITLDTSTDENGSYVFSGLVNGTYNISEETKADFTPDGQTYQLVTITGNDSANINFTNSPLIVTPTPTETMTVVPTPTETATPEPTPGAMGISGNVIEDVNADGAQDAGDTPLEGITVRLIGIDEEFDVVSTKTTTDSNGLYNFGDIKPGRYFVLVRADGFASSTGHVIRSVKYTGEPAGGNDFLLVRTILIEPTVTEPTITETPEETPTVTETPEETPTATETPEETPTATETPEETPTVTVTGTPTETMTVIPTTTETLSP